MSLDQAAGALTPALDGKLRAILAELRRRLEDLYGDRLVRVILYGSREILFGDLSLEHNAVISSVYRLGATEQVSEVNYPENSQKSVDTQIEG
ncbi:MAG: hypothetical protein HY238_23370 [Acidobacteria bacterium]|nr:hypothetical protein [Acidobacteriota bacterium]